MIMTDKLRQIKITANYSKYNGQTGYFHGFFPSGDIKDGLCSCAVVELETGEVLEIYAEGICFIPT